MNQRSGQETVSSAVFHSENHNALVRQVLMVVLSVSAFLIPWGEGVNDVVGGNISKLFILFVAPLTMGLSLILRRGDALFNRFITVWLIFLLLHTLIVYGLWKPELFEWGVIGSREIGGDAEKIQEGSALRILRFFLFALYGAAVSMIAPNPRTRSLVMLSFLAGINGVLIAGGYQIQAAPETAARLAGGSLDPNAFGLTCAIAICCSIATLTSNHRSRIINITVLLRTPASLRGLLESGARGALMGLAFGAVVFLLAGRFGRRGLLMTVLATIVFIACFSALPGDIQGPILDRFSPSSIIEDRGTSRPAIWHSYMKSFPNYALTGTGMYLSKSAVGDEWDHPRMTHNVYLQQLVEHGFIGALLLVAGLISLLRALWFRSPAMTGMLVCWMAASFFVDSLASRETWFIFGLASSTVRDQRRIS